MVAVARDYSSPTAKHNILPAAAMHTPVPRWVNPVISSVRKRLPLITQLRTSRCAARRPSCSPAKRPAAWRLTSSYRGGGVVMLILSACLRRSELGYSPCGPMAECIRSGRA